MTKPTLAECGWLEFVINDHLRPALKAAEDTLADLVHVRQCESADCDMIFDGPHARARRWHRHVPGL